MTKDPLMPPFRIKQRVESRNGHESGVVWELAFETSPAPGHWKIRVSWESGDVTWNDPETLVAAKD